VGLAGGRALGLRFVAWPFSNEIYAGHKKAPDRSGAPLPEATMTYDDSTRTRGLWEDCTTAGELNRWEKACEEARFRGPKPPPPGRIPAGTHLSHGWLLQQLKSHYGWVALDAATLVRRRA